MEKEFVPYEIALAMKELGFDEPCFRMYKKGDKHLISTMDIPNAIYSADIKIQAPLYQQAFRFFKEKYNLEVEYSLRVVMDDPNYYLRKLIEIIKENL